MQILSSKAFYLKNYSIKSRAKTEPKEDYSTPKESALKLDDIIRIRNIATNVTMHSFMPQIKQNREPSESSSHAKQSSKLQSIYQRQQDLLLKVVRFKQSEVKPRKWHSVSLSEDILLEKHPIAEVNSLQFESMKPTNRYFQKIENIRLAQRLLLARPSRDINRTSQQKFYQKQQSYKMNISKLSFRAHEQQGKRRKLHRKKWVD